MSEPTPQLAIIGDLHSLWDRADVTWFNESGYEHLLFTGDLGGSLARDGLSVARSIAELVRPALVILGNNDVEQYAEISAELTYRSGVADLMSSLGGARDVRAKGVSPGARTCGFDSHTLALRGLELTLIAGRPFAMGGNELSFPAALERSYGVASLAESRERLCGLVDAAPTEHLLFLSHNGPAGLGGEPSDAWGRDFGGETGDWGDQDLSDAVAYARARGRKPLAVIGGHMHWSPERRPRRWRSEVAGTLYVNAARVPRVIRTETGVQRWHLALTLTVEGASVREVLVPGERRS